VEYDSGKNISHQSNKRKISFDSEEKDYVKKPLVIMSQTNDSFAPNAESTKIINNSLLNSESYSDESKQIIKELSLEDIDFEEPLTPPKENKNDSSACSQNDEVKKNDEYQNRLQIIGKTFYLDNGNVTNLNTENISISQWSKGDVVLNGKPLKV